MTLLTRRSFTAGAAALATVPATPALASTASRSFQVTIDGNKVGTHDVSVERGPNGITARSVINIAPKIAFVTVYRYELSVTEVYDAEGFLVSINGTCNDDGDPHFVNVQRQGETLMVNGSSHQGAMPLSTGASSHWNKALLGRTPWISTQSGEILSVTASEISSAEAPAGASAYRVSNGADVTIDMFYDSRGEWVGSAFDAESRRLKIEYLSETGALKA